MRLNRAIQALSLQVLSHWIGSNPPQVLDQPLFGRLNFGGSPAVPIVMNAVAYEYDGSFPIAHYGYLDGINGRPPNPEMTGWDDYDTGWLHGDADKGDAAKLAVLQPTSLQKGSVVLVPKGVAYHSMKDGWQQTKRYYRVFVHRVAPVTPAQINRRTGAFEPPQPACVVWAGPGRHWRMAAANVVSLAPAE